MTVSRSIFLLIVVSIIIGFIYVIFNPSHNIEENLELNINYFPAVTEERVEGR